MDKPPDMASLDHATANLLQMSVPDPSTTFLGKITDYTDDYLVMTLTQRVI